MTGGYYLSNEEGKEEEEVRGKGRQEYWGRKGRSCSSEKPTPRQIPSIQGELLVGGSGKKAGIDKAYLKKRGVRLRTNNTAKSAKGHSQVQAPRELSVRKQKGKRG